MRRLVNWLVVVLSLVFLLVGMTLGENGSSGTGSTDERAVPGSSRSASPAELDADSALPHPYRAQTALYRYEIPDEETAANATLTEADTVTPMQVRERF